MIPIRPSQPASRNPRTTTPCETNTWCEARSATGQSVRRAPYSLCVAEERDHPGLVVRDPVVDEAAEPVEDDVGVLDEPLDEVARRPAALRPGGPAGDPSGRASPAARSRARAAPRRGRGRSRGPCGSRGRARRAGCAATRSRTGSPGARATASGRGPRASGSSARRRGRPYRRSGSGRRGREAVPDRLAAAVDRVAPSIWKAAVAAPHMKPFCLPFVVIP